jgi:hypothetical protein
MNSVAHPLFERLEVALRDAASLVAQMRASAQTETTDVLSRSEYLSVKQLANRHTLQGAHHPQPDFRW